MIPGILFSVSVKIKSIWVPEDMSPGGHYRGCCMSWYPVIESSLCNSFEHQFNCINTLRPRQNGCHLADDTFKRIFLNENVRISIKISLKFVPKGPIINNPALVQIMAGRRSGDKPLSEPMMVSLLTHICVTRPQWVNLKTGRHDSSYSGGYQGDIPYWYQLASGTQKCLRQISNRYDSVYMISPCRTTSSVVQKQVFIFLLTLKKESH